MAARPHPWPTDIGCQSAGIIGAVCPDRDTGITLVPTRLDTGTKPVGRPPAI